MVDLKQDIYKIIKSW